MGKAMPEFGLECIRLRMAEISATQYEIAQRRETMPRSACGTSEAASPRKKSESNRRNLT
jgi:hypothetical protein